MVVNSINCNQSIQVMLPQPPISQLGSKRTQQYPKPLLNLMALSKPSTNDTLIRGLWVAEGNSQDSRQQQTLYTSHRITSFQSPHIAQTNNSTTPH